MDCTVSNLHQCNNENKKVPEWTETAGSNCRWQTAVGSYVKKQQLFYVYVTLLLSTTATSLAIVMSIRGYVTRLQHCTFGTAYHHRFVLIKIRVEILNMVTKSY
jgi:hypothetical protein